MLIKTIKILFPACGMIFKLRCYVLLSTLELIFYCMFHSIIQYSLLNWGRAFKIQLHIIKISQNRFLRANFFHYSRTSFNVFYNEFRVLKLEDMISYVVLVLDSNRGFLFSRYRLFCYVTSIIFS